MILPEKRTLMKIETHVHQWSEVDIDEVAQLLFTTRQASPFWRSDQKLDSFRQFIEQRRERFSPSFVILARTGETLVGMMGIITENPSLYDLWRWHPIVLPGENEDEIASALIKASIHQMKVTDIHDLEICFDFSKEQITPAAVAYYQKYKSWYAQYGAVKLDEFVYMTCQSESFIHLSKNSLEAEFEVRNLSMQNKDDLYDCFYQAFLEGKDRSFLAKNEEQRRITFDEYFEHPENLNSSGSLILLKNHQVAGYTVFNFRPRIGDEHLSLICIHPEHQGKRLGQQLLSLSMSRIAQLGNKLFSLGVDLDNTVAYHLYRKMGFETQRKIITHIWKDEDLS